MNQATCWEPPEESTISGVASRIMREMNQKPPNVFRYNLDSANRGRMNAAKTSHDKAVARRAAKT